MRLVCTLFLVLSAAAQNRTLPDGTPVRLRLSRTVSSATAHVGDIVDFEIAEPVTNRDYVVIAKGAVALGRVTKVETRRRFGRAGELELSIDSVRLSDGRSISLRATPEKGPGDMKGGRVAATIAAAPVLVWVKGKDVTFEKGTETTAYVNGDAIVDEPLRTNQGSGGATLSNLDVIQMVKAGLSEDIVLNKIASSPADFRTGAQDLIQLKESGVSDNVIKAMVDKSSRH
jgi:hypothetical protein